MPSYVQLPKLKHRNKMMLEIKENTIFSKFVRELSTAIVAGGSDPEVNQKLRLAMWKAKRLNYPKSTVDKAMTEASSLAETSTFVECIYEAYTRSGVALFIEALTQNKNSTLRDFRTTIARNGGALADPGTIIYMFKNMGYITYPGSVKGEDEMLELAADAGADDVKLVDDQYEVVSSVENFLPAKEFLEKEIGEPTFAERIWKPNHTKALNNAGIETVLQLIDTLEDFIDVQNVWCNLEIPKDYVVPG